MSDWAKAAVEALERLRAGNRRFARPTAEAQHGADAQRNAGVEQGGAAASASPVRQFRMTAGDRPCAVILCCSDARVPAEIIFDQGLGDLFVIRVAGNFAAPSQIGSVEFAAERFGTRLVVVLGHSQCGAVAATLEELQHPSEQLSPNLRAIVDRVRPAFDGLIGTSDDREALKRQAMRRNVRLAIEQLRTGSAVLERLVRNEGLVLLGAQYSVETGAVEFFEEPRR